ncbi:hypothetical protein QBC38DRAFT_121443 [Podospora fimiseda]|uniref:Uncharacterized protein n=1 Tax=Podospora fimiseda TaxID=252190 RepID=A0AAN6YM46_9PEZI|nr:hypothetical protein QBC38DRAFT_121443 [Podospora fimiseda]
MLILPEERKDELKLSTNLQDWEDDEVVKALKVAFLDEKTYKAFNHCLLKVGKVLWELTNDFIAAKMLRDFCRNCRVLEKNMRSVSRFNRFGRRVRLLKRKENLVKAIVNLRQRVKVLGELMDTLPDLGKLPVRPLHVEELPVSPVPPSTPQVVHRDLARLLFLGVLEAWINCNARRHTKHASHLRIALATVQNSLLSLSTEPIRTVMGRL